VLNAAAAGILPARSKDCHIGLCKKLNAPGQIVQRLCGGAEIIKEGLQYIDLAKLLLGNLDLRRSALILSEERPPIGWLIKITLFIFLLLSPRQARHAG
jgi:hypothetical protein